MHIKNYISLTTAELLVGLTVLVFVAAVVGGSRLSRLSNSKAIYAKEPVDIYLESSENLEQLSSVLVDSGVVADRQELIWAATLLGWKNFNSGHYQLDGGYSYNTFLSKLARGIQDPVSLTIIPGQSEKRIFVTLTHTFKFDSLALVEVVNDSSFIQELGINRQSLVGYMYPDTYSMYWTSSPRTVLKRIVEEFNQSVYEPNKGRFKELGKSVNQIVTLASIIEWEATHDEEKAAISGLYWNRLKRGMRLQADPTVNYAIKERRRLLYEDYQVDHPYNTYLHKGLPPGPITNPALSSIEAALYPADNDYLYMVASPGGYHVFSKTFAEHQKQSEKWRKWLRKQYRLKRQHEKEQKSQGGND